MRVFIQSKNGIPQDYDHCNAYCGFKEMGFETIFFETYEELALSNKEDVVVGYIGTVKRRLSDFGTQISEYRSFVRYGKILDVRRYKGDWRVYPDSQLMEECVGKYTNSPYGYAIDFGVTKEGETVLIEVNNTCSLGSYGLYCIDYAKLLSARWSELMGTEDECNF